MNRLTFLKTLGAVLLAPKALANIKPGPPKFIHKEYAAGFIITREMIEDDMMYPTKVKVLGFDSTGNVRVRFLQNK
jgi:hypothetical protein